MQIMTTYDATHLAYWEDYHPVPATFGAPAGMEADCSPAAALVTRGDNATGPEMVVRVGWKPNEIDLAHLAQGGVIWLSMWGGLAPHMLEVQAPERGPVGG